MGKMTTSALIGIIAGVIVIIFILIPASEVLWSMFSSDFDAGTRESFDMLDGTILYLETGGETTYLIYMNKDQMLVAFDKAANEGSGVYERPPECFNKACLIVCRNDGAPESCLNSRFIATYDFEGFIPTNMDSGIVSIGQKEYVPLQLKWVGSKLSITE